jgi:hypothetical protein
MSVKSKPVEIIRTEANTCNVGIKIQERRKWGQERRNNKGMDTYVFPVTQVALKFYCHVVHVSSAANRTSLFVQTTYFDGF